MSIIGKFVDGLLDVAEDIVSAPFKAIDRLGCAGGHRWMAWRRKADGTHERVCADCGKTEET